MKYKELFSDILFNNRSDYSEIRIEETDSTRLVYKGKELDNVSQNIGFGGNVRSAYKGGWGFSSFNFLPDLEKDLRNIHGEAFYQAKSIGDSKTNLAEAEPNIDKVVNCFGKNPNLITIKEKKELMEHYLGIIFSSNKISSADVIYGDMRRKVYFGNSDGTYIEQEYSHVISRISIQTRVGDDILESGFSIGSLGDYELVENLDDLVLEHRDKAIELLKSNTLPGGEKTVVLDPILAGVFVHEAFGHLSEADNVYENKELRDLMFLGRKFGGEHLNFTDGGLIDFANNPLRGSYKYDDEGTPATISPLVREGELVGRLHSRETAAKLGEKPTGNARSIGYSFPPIVRMTNTIIEPGIATVDDLFNGIKDGIYVKNWHGGMTQHEMFTFTSGESYMIRNGKIAEAVRPVKLSGNLFTTLKNIDGVANDLEMNQGGGCGKSGQSPLPVSNGSPHIRIQNCLIS